MSTHSKIPSGCGLAEIKRIKGMNMTRIHYCTGHMDPLSPGPNH